MGCGDGVVGEDAVRHLVLDWRGRCMTIHHPQSGDWDGPSNNWVDHCCGCRRASFFALDGPDDSLIQVRVGPHADATAVKLAFLE